MIKFKENPDPAPSLVAADVRRRIFAWFRVGNPPPHVGGYEMRRDPLSKRALSPNAFLPLDMEKEPGWKLHNILAATDFSNCSNEAVARAAALARHHNARLTILHVIDLNPPAARDYCGPAESLMRQLWVTGNSELCRLSESLAKNRIKSQPLIVEGLPAEAIVENSSGFDLLVIGERRAKPAWNFFSRHTARHTIEHAQCPVLVVHQEAHLFGLNLESTSKIAA